MKDRLSVLLRASCKKELDVSDPNWYFDFLDTLSNYYLIEKDNFRAYQVLKGLDYVDCFDCRSDYDKLFDRRSVCERT